LLNEILNQSTAEKNSNWQKHFCIQYNHGKDIAGNSATLKTSREEVLYGQHLWVIVHILNSR